MSDENAPVEAVEVTVAEEISEQQDNAVAEALKVVAGNGKHATPNDFKQVLQNLKQAVDDKLEEEGINPRTGPDPDRFIKLARELAAANYNEGKPGRNKLKPENVHIVWYSKVLSNWKAVVSSPLIRGIMWEITYNGYKHEAYVDVYKKTANVKVEGVDPK